MTLLSSLDIILIIILVLLSFWGLIRGFLKELSSIVNWVGSFYFTAITKPFVLPKIEKRITIPLLPDIITNVILFIVFMILLSIIMNHITDYIKLKKVLPFSTDRLLGFIFGFFKSILVCGFILTCMDMINKNSTKKLESLENSLVYDYFSKSKNKILNSVLESLLGDFLTEIQKNKSEKKDNNNNKKNKIKEDIKDMDKLIDIIVD